ncbi:MAG: ACT domain-containing protein [bacterium]|jgi:predicted amino acid-binding ACT domain protein|nr:ACT domain-containing protein [bacterium]
MTEHTRYVISVLSPDKVGILKKITSAIADLGGNIDGMSQTVVNHYFTVIIMAQFQAIYTHESIREMIRDSFDDDGVSVVVQNYQESELKREPKSTDRYILTLTGKDRPGILKTVTSYLADNEINIEDYYFTILGEQVTHIGELSVPVTIDIKQLQGELQTLVSAIDLVATLQHENLFRVANDIFAIRQLFKRKPCEK